MQENNFRFYGLDNLRALAISMVIVCHYQNLSHYPVSFFSKFIHFGRIGVDLFFVLSGFLIANQLFIQIKNDNKIEFAQFFIKRFFRIIPLYLIVLSIYFMFPFIREKECLPPLWKFLTFSQNFELNSAINGTFSQAWSLCVVEHFYLIFPLILFLLIKYKQLKNGILLVLIFFILGLIFRDYSWRYLYHPFLEMDKSWILKMKYVYYPSYNRIDGLLVGICLAVLFQFKSKLFLLFEGKSMIILLIGFFLIALGIYLAYYPASYKANVISYPIFAFGFGFISFNAICKTA